MPMVEWNDSLRLDIAVIDSQHRQLVDMLSGLHDAMAQGQGKERLGATITGLVDYATTHFATEEAYFARYGYPDADVHAEQHRGFVEKLEDFHTGFEQERLFLTLDLMDFLSTWLVDHIKGSDRAYAPFLNAQGVR